VNIQPSTALQGLTGWSSQYSHLCSFRCVAFVLFQCHERTKLSTQLVQCVFLGYDSEHKGYCCWDSVVRHIRFLVMLPLMSLSLSSLMLTPLMSRLIFLTWFGLRMTLFPPGHHYHYHHHHPFSITTLVVRVLHHLSPLCMMSLHAPSPPSTVSITCKWVYKTKTRSDGSI
jgi:hypothetical protein